MNNTIDQEKVKKLRRIIYGREFRNSRRPRPKKDSEMKIEILTLIKERADKCL